MHARAPCVTTTPSAIHREERVMAIRITRIASLPGLLLLLNAAAWAGRGDMDPDYGFLGKLVTEPEESIFLPDDRLLRLEAGESVSEFRVRVFDRTGHDDSAFGEGGLVAI